MASATDPISTIPAGTLKTAAEAGYTIRKLGSNNISGLHLISGNIVVWQEGTGVTATLKLFDGKETKTLSTETSNYYKALNFSSLVASYAHIDSGKVVWGQYVDEPSAGGTPLPAYHTFLYDGTNTTDIGKTGGNAQIGGDRIVWAAADGIHVYRISDKSNTLLVPEAKNVDSVTLVIDGDKSIVWNENTRGTSLSGVSAQTLRFYDGTKIVDIATLPAGQDAYTQPAIIRADVAGSKVVYVSKGDLYLYNNGQSTKIAESVSPSAVAGIDFGISGDRVFYHVLEPYKGLSNERWYGISSGKTENPIENNLSSAGSLSDPITLSSAVSVRNPITDGKNNAWIDPEYVLVTPANPAERDSLYIDDGATRVKLATSDISLSPYGTFVPAAISGSSVAYDILTKDAKTGSILFDLYLASKDSSPTIPVVPVITAPVITTPVITTPVVTQPVVVTDPPVVAAAVITPPVVVVDPPVVIAPVVTPPVNTINASPAVTPTIASSFIPGITVAQNLFTTDATIKGFGISAVSQKSTNKVNEIGIFAVDDATGKIGSIAPGSPEYLKAALNIAKPIFTSLAGDFLNKSNQEFSIDPNKTYQFFEVEDGSIADAKQQISGGKIPTNLLFSTSEANGSSPIKVTNNSNNDGYQISINADELVLNVVKLAGTNVNSPIGTKSQAAPEGRTIDLTDYAGQTLKADITTTSSAAYTNNIGFYAVEDSIGSIKLADGIFVKPGDANYAVEAIKSALTNSLQAGKTDSKLDQNIIGGRIYAPVVVTEGTFADFASKNPTNSGGSNNVHAYFNYIGANSDNVDHFRLIGNNKFGVEDMYGGGDRDFNDLVVSMNIKV